MKTVAIMQLKKELVRITNSRVQNISFMSYDYVVKKFNGVQIEDYETVYTCERDDDYDADEAFIEFNTNHPADYKGHSLSVSDIIMIDNSLLYVDSLGFQKLISW